MCKGSEPGRQRLPHMFSAVSLSDLQSSLQVLQSVCCLRERIRTPIRASTSRSIRLESKALPFKERSRLFVVSNVFLC